MIKRALLLLLLTAVWAFGSWWYYTCMIKGFCRTNGTFTSAADRAKTVAATGAAAITATATGLVNTDQDNNPDTNAPVKDDPSLEPETTAADTSTQNTLAATIPEQATTTGDFIDQDNDAISDEDERRLGTDPAKDDSDGDGLKDNIELGTDMQSPTDTDQDGIIDALDEDDDNDTLSTSQELELGTNPRLADTDDDALSDAAEALGETIGTNPLNADTDGDGISDGSEVGTNPSEPMDSDKDGIIDALDQDDDNDGISTALEIRINSDPLNQDSDGDGINDGDELGTDPNQPKDSDGDGVIDLLDSDNSQASEQNDAQAQTNVAPQSREDTAPETQQAAPEPTNDQAQVNEPASDDQVTMNQDNDQSGGAAGITIQKSRLYFPSRSANPRLSEAATNYFKQVAQWLNADPAHRVVLTGHTDSVGRAKNNLELGLKRAVEIKNMMVKLGANEAQIDVASMGETQPIASNDTDSGRRKNRRVELIPSLKQ